MIDVSSQLERADRLKQARSAAGYASAKSAAERFGWNYNTYSQHERGHVGIGRMAANYARAFRVSEAWLLTGEDMRRPASRIPLLGAAAGSVAGAWRFENEPIDRIDCPPGLAGVENAYAVFVRGNSMAPEHKDGELRFVNPVRRPVSGDSVIIQARGENGQVEAWIKRYIRENDAEIVTEQLDPPAFVRFQRRHVVKMEKVCTMNELFPADQNSGILRP